MVNFFGVSLRHGWFRLLVSQLSLQERVCHMLLCRVFSKVLYVLLNVKHVTVFFQRQASQSHLQLLQIFIANVIVNTQKILLIISSSISTSKTSVSLKSSYRKDTVNRGHTTNRTNWLNTQRIMEMLNTCTRLQNPTVIHKIHPTSQFSMILSKPFCSFLITIQ